MKGRLRLKSPKAQIPCALSIDRSVQKEKKGMKGRLHPVMNRTHVFFLQRKRNGTITHFVRQYSNICMRKFGDFSDFARGSNTRLDPVMTSVNQPDPHDESTR
jgi:hypothetical protein